MGNYHKMFGSYKMEWSLSDGALMFFFNWIILPSAHFGNMANINVDQYTLQSTSCKFQI